MRQVKSMDHSIPLWVFLLCFLMWSLFTVLFGWVVKSTLAGSDRSGVLGKVAVEIASFPSTAKAVLLEVTLASKKSRDESVRVDRGENADYSGFKPVPTEVT